MIRYADDFVILPTGRVRLPGLPLRAGLSGRAVQTVLSLAGLLQTQLLHDVQADRPMGPHAAAKHFAAACKTARTGSGSRSSTLAERVLCRAWAVLDRSSLCGGRSTPLWVNHRPESRMREIRPSGSEGGGTGNQPVLPTPIARRRCRGSFAPWTYGARYFVGLRATSWALPFSSSQRAIRIPAICPGG